MRALLAAIAVWLFVIGIIGLVLDVRNHLAALEGGQRDNGLWVMTQTEVEILRLQLAVGQAMTGQTTEDGTPALQNVRNWFDVLYSRVMQLGEGPIYAAVLDRYGNRDLHASLRGFLDRTVPLIDGTDTDLRAALPGLAAELPQLQEEARTLTLSALTAFAQQSDRQRQSVKAALVQLALLTVAFVLVLSYLAVSRMRLHRHSQTQALAIGASSARLQMIVATSADAIVVTSRGGHVVEFNPAAEVLFGVSRADILGEKALQRLFPQDLADAYRRLFTDLIETGNRAGTPMRVEVESPRSDGSTLSLEVSVATTTLQPGARVVAFVRDITERRQTDRDLTTALDRALAGEQARARFLAVMSHEMRTPLNGLIGAIDLFEATPLTPDQRRLVEMMATSGTMLLQQVNAVLDITQAEAGPGRNACERFDLDRLVEDCLTNQSGLARAAGNTLGSVQAGSPVGAVCGDPGRLRQILLNLIGNAVKFTQNGRITVETERLPPLDAIGGVESVEIRVIDSGIGIPEADLTRVFDDFVTLDASYGRKAGGTGLGLGIARRLAEAIGGSIGVESEEGAGSVFWVRLPLPPPPDVAAGTGDARPQAAPVTDDTVSLSVLMIDDNETGRFLLRRTLEMAGHRVSEAEDGLAGLERAETEAFDVILTDISMPGLDGVALTQRIRSGGGPSAAARILALTAHALPEEVARFRQSGMDDCLTKPVARSDLLAALRPGVERASNRQDVAECSALIDRRVSDDLARHLGPGPTADLLRRLVADGDAVMHRLFPKDKIAALDADRMAADCHLLAGASGTFGAGRLHATLLEAAQRLRGGADLAATLAPLSGIWALTRAALQDEAQRLQVCAAQ